jgi:DNA invertase Pin-like site-specific DNA recombinase
MIRHAERGDFDVIIAYKSDRFARNMLQNLVYEEKLSKIGVKVLYTKEEFGDSAAGRFALRTMMNVNQFYSENMSENILRGLRDNAEHCMVTNGRLPIGYKKSEDGTYVLDQPKDEIVREIFRRVADGEPFADIASDMNARGIKTSSGNKWGKNSFHAMLKNERYTGVYIYDDIRKEGGVPQIVDKVLFYKVQEVLTTKKNPQGRHRIAGDYLLTGKLFCGKCKSPMIGVSGTGKSGKLHHYYACQKKRSEKTCDKSAVRRDWIEMEVAAAIKEHVLRPDVIDWIADSCIAYAKEYKQLSDIALLEGQLSDTKTAIKNIMSAIEKGITTRTTKDRLMELEEEQVKIVAKLAVEQADVLNVSRDDIAAWLWSFKDGDIEDKEAQAKFFNTFLIAVYLYDDELRIVFEFTGNKKSVRIPLSSIVDSVNEACAQGSLEVSFGPPKSNVGSDELLTELMKPSHTGLCGVVMRKRKSLKISNET